MGRWPGSSKHLCAQPREIFGLKSNRLFPWIYRVVHFFVVVALAWKQCFHLSKVAAPAGREFHPSPRWGQRSGPSPGSQAGGEGTAAAWDSALCPASLFIIFFSIGFFGFGWAGSSLLQADFFLVVASRGYSVVVVPRLLIAVASFVATWRREWLPIPVFLLGESHGQRSLAGYSPRGREESAMTKHAYPTL